ncbi:hypothetical protein HX882_32140 [Pseudomonas gingeri]|uniref:Uncharacterized protein n=1 Tax=Pseudomonas gingeri TaxID=117681 RepID=A0A7Y8C6M0_9PSED|nr:hypothetical protein [Pseudomonas gingeri]NWC00532.1 hypothetical protein [Pseudomonas gingeri]
MKIYPAFTREGARIPAFNVENAYVGPATIAQLLAGGDGVTEVKARKMFSGSSDVHIRFTC